MAVFSYQVNQELSPDGADVWNQQRAVNLQKKNRMIYNNKIFCHLFQFFKSYLWCNLWWDIVAD